MLVLPLKLRSRENSVFVLMESGLFIGSRELIPFCITSLDSTPGLKKYCLSFHFTEMFS